MLEGAEGSRLALCCGPLWAGVPEGGLMEVTGLVWPWQSAQFQVGLDWREEGRAASYGPCGELALLLLDYLICKQ